MGDASDVLSRLDPAMLVVTVRAGDERSGCLVGFHAQSSIDPLRYEVRISKANHTFRVALAADVFTLHLLGEGDRALATLFGETTGDEIDKFARCAWREGTGGAPLLDDCATRVLARPVGYHDDGGDHVGFVVEPFEVHAPDPPWRPLRYSTVAELDAGHAATEPPNVLGD
jgi:flavin reductase (DIM6/NTAB) family NADH-FMN oxidoreductase RutF